MTDANDVGYIWYTTVDRDSFRVFVFEASPHTARLVVTRTTDHAVLADEEFTLCHEPRFGLDVEDINWVKTRAIKVIDAYQATRT